MGRPRSRGVAADLLDRYRRQGLALAAMTTPLAPGGSGVAELGAAAIFTSLAPGLSPLFVATWRGCTFYMNLAVGGVAAARMWPTPSPGAPTAPQVAR